jgi:hypothetical protein
MMVGIPLFSMKQIRESVIRTMNLISSEPKIGQFARKSQRIRLLQGKIRAIMCMFLAKFRHRLFVGGQQNKIKTQHNMRWTPLYANKHN